RDQPIPTTPGLEQFVRNKPVAIALGKALFWDMKVGSDGQACASCHFAAGADNRMKNQISPGLRGGDTAFGTTPARDWGPNYTLQESDFPLHRLADPLDRDSDVLFTTNDVVSSAGTFEGDFIRVKRKAGEKCGQRDPDSFMVHGKFVRKVEPRNTPTTINAVFNFRNFWDGRASNVFNGVSPFGPRDPDARVLQANADGSLSWVKVALENASLASQAVGPPLSDFEMSCGNKTFRDLGRKLVSMRPLADQDVHAADSVLAAYRRPGGKGLKHTYGQLIRAAFDPRWWDSRQVVDGYSQIEHNFPLFWGLAIQLYACDPALRGHAGVGPGAHRPLLRRCRHPARRLRPLPGAATRTRHLPEQWEMHQLPPRAGAHRRRVHPARPEPGGRDRGAHGRGRCPRRPQRRRRSL
ncbi:MAG: Methylamine utilization protein mauG, partial [Proteobacteria bacterium]|nr:Methylamine utilization protein mauG [Pseudomonadota bacterium]